MADYPNGDLLSDLVQFRGERSVSSKGSLSVVLHITRMTLEYGLPLNRTALRTSRQGQVAGLGRSRVQRILSEHGITRELASEGGRTSRGSLGLAEAYAGLLNEMQRSGEIPIEASAAQAVLAGIEAWWIARVHDYFNAEHLRLSSDPSYSPIHVLSEVLQQARRRQQEVPGSTIEGAVLQHLVGATLDVRLGPGAVTHQSYSTADSPTVRSGDFDIQQNALSIHVTVSPTERLLEKCRANIAAGRQPIIVVPEGRIAATETLAENAGIRDRVAVYGAERLIGFGVTELAVINGCTIAEQWRALIDVYNKLITAYEHDPSLQIDVAS